ncbi:DUF1641 domain-containing protein [Nocardioides salsibiostraticola]
MTLAPSREASAQAALQARLEDPQVAASLATLLDHADLLAVMLEGLDGFIARSEVIGASLADGVSELRGIAGGSAFADLAAEVDVPALLAAATSLAEVLPKVTPPLVAAFEGGAPEELAKIGAGVAQGNADYAAGPVEIGGAFSLLKLLKDPDINRTLSYFATVAKAVGRELGTTSTTAKNSAPS